MGYKDKSVQNFFHVAFLRDVGASGSESWLGSHAQAQDWLMGQA